MTVVEKIRTRRANQARHGRFSGDEADLSPGGADGGTARATVAKVVLIVGKK